MMSGKLGKLHGKELIVSRVGMPQRFWWIGWKTWETIIEFWSGNLLEN